MKPVWPQPPKNAVRFFRFYCAQHLQEELLGDLEELYFSRLENGDHPFVAKCSFWWNVLNCCKPYAFKKKYSDPSHHNNALPMLFNFLKTISRSFNKNLSYNLLNLSGLAIGFATFLLVIVYVVHETSYEKFHAKADNIHRLTVHYFSSNGYNTHFARVDAPWINSIPDEVPEVKSLIRFQNHEPKFVRIGEEKFTQEHAFTTDAEVFDVFDFVLLHGNVATALKEPFSVVISQSLALKYFGTSDVVGRDIYITRYWMDEEETYKITGVMADLPLNTHLPVEMLTSFRNEAERSWWAYTYLLLEPNANAEAVKEKIMALLVKNSGEASLEGTDYVLQPIRSIHLNSHLAREIVANNSKVYINIYIGTGCFILLIAIINFMNLSSVMAIGRSKELGIRRVMGSSKRHLILYAITDSMVMALSGVLAGYLLSLAMMGSFESLAGITNMLSWQEQIGILIATSIVCGLPSAIYPAFLLNTMRLTGILKSGKSHVGVKGNRGFGFKKVLVTCQFAICILLIGSALIARQQFDFLNSSNLRSNQHQLLAITSVPDPVKGKFLLFKNALTSKPGVVGVSACLEVPSREIRDGGSVKVDGIHNDDAENLPSMDIQVIDHDFLEVAGLELLAGEPLPKSLVYSTIPNFDGQITVEDYLLSKRRAYIINETAMRRIGWSEPKEAIGQMMTWNQGNYAMQKGPIVGVIKDYHQESLKNEIDPVVMVFEPLWLRTFLVKIDTEQLNQAINATESVWNTLFPHYPFEYKFVDELYEKLYKVEQQQLQMLYLLCGLAIFIAFLGLFGLVAFALKTRTKELAIRKVLGATYFKMIWLFGKEYAWIVLAACILAIPISYTLVMKWLEDYAYRIEISWLSYFITIGMIVTMLITTIAYHTIKSDNINPITNLREE